MILFKKKCRYSLSWQVPFLVVPPPPPPPPPPPLFRCFRSLCMREHLKRIVEVFIGQNMSKLSLIHSTNKAGRNTEIYGQRSEYGFLPTEWRPIRMQNSLKPYNNIPYLLHIRISSYWNGHSNYFIIPFALELMATQAANKAWQRGWSHPNQI